MKKTDVHLNAEDTTYTDSQSNNGVETREEVLDRVLMKLSKLTDEQLERFVRLAREQGIELDEQP